MRPLHFLTCSVLLILPAKAIKVFLPELGNTWSVASPLREDSGMAIENGKRQFNFHFDSKPPRNSAVGFFASRKLYRHGEDGREIQCLIAIEPNNGM